MDSWEGMTLTKLTTRNAAVNAAFALAPMMSDDEDRKDQTGRLNRKVEPVMPNHEVSLRQETAELES